MDKSLNPVVGPSPMTFTSDHVHQHYRPWKWVAHLALLISDQILVVLGFAVAYWLRYHATWPPSLRSIVAEVPSQSLAPFHAFLPVMILLIIILTILFETRGLYRLPRGSGLLMYADAIFSSTIIGIAIIMVFVFLYRPYYYSRLIFAFAGGAIVVLLLLWRVLLLRVRQWGWRNGIGCERVLVVGGNGLSRQVMEGIMSRPEMGYHLVGYLHHAPQIPPDHASFPHLGTIHHLRSTVESRSIHQVILALPFWEHHYLPQLINLCRELGVEFRIVPDFYEISFDRVDVQHISGVPLIGLKELSIKGWNLAVKRGLDIGLTVLSAPLTLLLSLLIALAIRLDSPGGALFCQTRVGKHGRLFTCYKFRTMVHDAEKRKAELEALNEADGPLFKMRCDPRVTRVGRFLRRSSLDELPQLWNVLRGDMSLVGPRPAIPTEVEQYQPWHCRRLEVTPGLTGLWQVLGRSDTSFEEMVRLDIYYAENWSVWMDIHILLRTIPTVVMGRGAY
ncbi:MAG: sugar transferase [Chloroflexaceae bacterium]|nr:sugar transferase [Chloroflexaceae bacterium]